MNRLGFVFTTLLLVLAIASSMLFVVDQRQFGILYALGQIKEVITEPGLNFKLPPPFQNVTYIDKRLLTLDSTDAAPMLTAAYLSASEAISGMNAVAGWGGAPRPVPARELLPERALLGDTSAVAALYNEITRPLADAGPALSETLDAYLDSGGAIEACARKLFVHPNTVRYRLRRIADVTGRDPTVPRDSYVLRVATTVGRLGYPASPQTPAQTSANVAAAQRVPPLVGG